MPSFLGRNQVVFGADDAQNSVSKRCPRVGEHPNKTSVGIRMLWGVRFFKDGWRRVPSCVFTALGRCSETWKHISQKSAWLTI